MPKKSKIKEINYVDDDDDDVVPLPTVTEWITTYQPVTSSTPYNWSATPLPSLDHSYCMNEGNMSLPSYLGLADKIKAPKIENNILNKGQNQSFKTTN